jgi:uncharacterized membrane protein YeaQ/YmgE (transglycosylase-associated protein family)
MPQLGIIGWLIIGFLAGVLSGMVYRDRSPGGCLGNILVGILGGVLGGFVAREFFGQEQIYGYVGAFVVAFVGAVIVRFLLRLGHPRA